MENRSDSNESRHKRRRGWGTAFLITALFTLLFGLPNFVVLGTYLPRMMSLERAAGWFAFSAAACSAVLLSLLLVLLNNRGRSLTDAGWQVPSSRVSIAFGLLFALLWLVLGHFNNEQMGIESNYLDLSPWRVFSALALTFSGCVEDFGLRGVMMNELKRSGVAGWLQVLVSGLAGAFYHSFSLIDDPSEFAIIFVFSAILGWSFAGLFLLGKRSLTPCMLSHGLILLVGEPFLIMGALAG